MHPRLRGLCAVAVAALCAAAALAQTRQYNPPGQPPPGQYDPPGQPAGVQITDLTPAGHVPQEIDPDAEQILRNMSGFLRGLPRFAFTTENVFDVVEPDGEKLQLSRWMRIEFERPNRAHVETRGDGEWDNAYWYDSRRLIMLNRVHNLFAVADVPPTIDEMLDYVAERYGLSMPTADLLFADPYEVLTRGVQRGRVIGMGRVGERLCHHLSFRQENVDWQIWIESQGEPVPRKLLVIYKDTPSALQFTATFVDWDLNPRFSPEVFSFRPPPGAEQIEWLALDEIEGEIDPAPAGSR